MDVFTEPGVGSDEIFEGMLNSLRFLDMRKEPCAIARLFEVRFLTALGLWPGNECFKLTKGAASTLLCFEREIYQVSSKIKLTREVGDEIKSITGEIISDNLDRPLRTLKMFG